jgi:ectoine hydroxylase-related dioxygenase (phytanoyl-CoA dioxygenase family)
MTLDIPALVAEFRETGFVKIEGLFGPAELAALNAKTRDVLAGAAGIPGETKVFDVEDSHQPQEPRVRRIKKPHEVDPLYRELAGFAPLVEVLRGIIGPDIRLHHSKINLKSARFGSPLEWHQDWAFIPHSNLDLAIAAIMLDAVDEENGPMLVIPGSHKDGLLDHHGEDGWFAAAIDPDKLDLDAAVPLTGPPGTVSIHHPLLVHGSALNRSTRERPLLFYEYAAADAWPLFYGVEWGEYSSRMIAGEASAHLRLEAVPVKMPHPVRSGGSIYNNQRDLKRRFFETYTEATTPA